MNRRDFVGASLALSATRWISRASTDTVATRDRENYGANFERLVGLKAKYDPMNLFRPNANVPPKI